MAPRRNRYWIWFFVLVGLLTTAAIVTLIAYNVNQQLKAEQVASARQRWEKQGPAGYDLFYKIHRQDASGVVQEEYAVKVRHGRAVDGTLRAGPHAKEKPLKMTLCPFGNVPAFFDALDDYLKQDARAGAPRSFMVALFDPRDGHLLHFVRSVSGVNQRVEVTVKEVKPAPPLTLTREALSAARQRWGLRKANLRDYRLEYLEGNAAAPGVRWAVAVRGGNVELVKRDDRVVSGKDEGFYDQERLFAKIAADLDADEAAGRSPAEACFDPVNGQVRWYRRAEPFEELLIDPVEPLAEQKS